MTDAPFVPIVPAGGSGTRLWPLSRAARPKLLLDLTGSGRSLLQQTVTRLEPLAERPALIVTGAAHADDVCAQVGDAADVLVEPAPRNSMPAIALAAAIAQQRDPEAIIGSFAADHLIEDADAFAASVRRAIAVAEMDLLVTLGIEPTHAATGFGYIQRGAAVDGEPAAADVPSAERIRAAGGLPAARFVEKPDRARAEEFVASGDFFWNAGMFVVRARVLLDALTEQIPPLAAGVRRIASAHGTDEQDEVLAREWPALMSIAIDHALAEPLAAQGRVAVVPAGFDWDDVGDFAALARQLRRAPVGRRVRRIDSQGCTPSDTRAETPNAQGDVSDNQSDEPDTAPDVVVLGSAPVAAQDASGTVHSDADRLIALVGVDAVSVVDTPDALLIVADAHAQDVGALARSLAERGFSDLR